MWFAATFEVVREVASLLDGDEATRDYRKLRVYPPKHMVLLPALPANVTICFTVSEVTIQRCVMP